MDSTLLMPLIVFVSLTTMNVVLNTARVILTIKGNAFVSALISALAFGFYAIMTIVIVSSPLDNWVKGLITALVNFAGTYLVKCVEARVRRQRLWLVDVVIYKKNLKYATDFLNKNGIWFSRTPISNSESHMFHIYSNTQDESRLIRKLLSKFHAKYVVVESKSL